MNPIKVKQITYNVAMRYCRVFKGHIKTKGFRSFRLMNRHNELIAYGSYGIYKRSEL